MNVIVYQKMVGLAVAALVLGGPVIVRANEPASPAKKPSVSKSRTSVSKKSTKFKKATKAQSDAETRAKAMKRLSDYNYVKQNFGLGGATYSPNKW